MTDIGSNIITISINQMKAAAAPYVIASSGIGSCVVVTLYNPVLRIGAMAHSMLPIPELKHKSSLCYVEDAIDAMILALGEMGVSKDRLEAKIIGGASMFKVFESDPNSIGAQNIAAAKKKLEKEMIKIVATNTGEKCGRSVVFDLVTGVVEVKTKI